MKSRNTSIADLSPAAQRQAAEQLANRLRKIAGVPHDPIPPKRAKYGNTKVTYKNIFGVERTYDSKKEANFAAQLDMWKRLGIIDYWIPQVRVPMPGGASHVIDFLVVSSKGVSGGSIVGGGVVTWYEVKGRDLPMGKTKRKLVKAIYGIDVEIV